MKLELHGKRASVTAASGGLGYATAEGIARETGATVRACAADVADADSLERFIEAATAALGGLDILVCNAGGPPAGGFLALREDGWLTAYHLTLMSVVRAVRFALPHFGDEGGRVLAIVSSSVKRPLDNLTLSNVFRPAVQGLCKSLSLELASRGIQVNCLAPGRVETERVNALDAALAARRGIGVQEVRAQSESQIPLGRLGRPEEFGRVAAFLCSPAALYVNGTTLLVDEGAVTCL